MTYQTFQTEHRVRPDDIDMFNHVHNSRYFDYVLAARYDHMEQFYGMSMDTFLERGYGWLYLKHVSQADKGCDFDFLEIPSEQAPTAENIFEGDTPQLG